MVAGTTVANLGLPVHLAFRYNSTRDDDTLPDTAILLQVRSSHSKYRTTSRKEGAFMQISQALTIGLNALRKNKMRTILTMLGIIIGIAAVIGMVSVGGGAQLLVLGELQRVGAANMVVVYRPDRIEENGKRIPNRSASQLEYEDVVEIEMTCPSVENVTPEISGFTLPASFEGTNKTVNIAASDPSYTDGHNWYAVQGRFLNNEDLDEARRVCVVGSEIQADLFEGGNPVGREIKVAGVRMTVIGVMKEKGDKMASEGWDNTAIMPLTTMQRYFIGRDLIGVLFVQAQSFEVIDDALAEVKLAMMRRHEDADKAFEYFSIKEALDSVQRVSLILQVLLGGVASIALFVGGIGIMNIMLVSVTERTREIGLRKAIGAKRADVLMQFLSESVVISVIGGIFGILVGAGIGMLASFAVTRFLLPDVDWPAAVSTQAAVIAFLTSAAIGIFFGLYPANKAARMLPTEALRHE